VAQHLHGRAYTELTQIQAVALAGEFYRETVAAHRDYPGRPVDWQLSLERHEKKKKSRIAFSRSVAITASCSATRQIHF
jgi:hypothetical protein